MADAKRYKVVETVRNSEGKLAEIVWNKNCDEFTAIYTVMASIKNTAPVLEQVKMEIIVINTEKENN